jgi:hypothetical protein
MLGATLISAGASLAGGLLNKKTADKQMKMQQEFAKKGIQWRVKDAQEAGIHPLYALGASAPTYSPVGSQGAVGDALASMGQDIGNAIYRNQTASERRQTMLDAKTKADEAHRMDMALRNAQIDHLNAQSHRLTMQQAPPMPDGKINADAGIPREGTVSSPPGRVRAIQIAPGKWLRVSPGATAEEWERQYGEFPAFIHGTSKYVGDLYSQGKRRFGRWLDKKMGYFR